MRHIYSFKILLLSLILFNSCSKEKDELVLETKEYFNPEVNEPQNFIYANRGEHLIKLNRYNGEIDTVLQNTGSVFSIEKSPDGVNLAFINYAKDSIYVYELASNNLQRFERQSISNLVWNYNSATLFGYDVSSNSLVTIYGNETINLGLNSSANIYSIDIAGPQSFAVAYTQWPISSGYVFKVVEAGTQVFLENSNFYSFLSIKYTKDLKKIYAASSVDELYKFTINTNILNRVDLYSSYEWDSFSYSSERNEFAVIQEDGFTNDNSLIIFKESAIDEGISAKAFESTNFNDYEW